MEFKELLLAVEHLFQEFFSAGSTAHLLPRPHLLLKAINCAGLFLAVCENALPFVEFTIDQLLLKKVVTVALAHEF